jgi:hypothetical protein
MSAVKTRILAPKLKPSAPQNVRESSISKKLSSIDSGSFRQKLSKIMSPRMKIQESIPLSPKGAGGTISSFKKECNYS